MRSRPLSCLQLNVLGFNLTRIPCGQAGLSMRGTRLIRIELNRHTIPEEIAVEVWLRTDINLLPSSDFS